MNKLYFGDNLEIMREMDDGIVDLICTDPPFNSGRNYNAFLKSDAQQKAFKDIWTYDDAAVESRIDIEKRSISCDTYKALDNCLKGFDMVFQGKSSGKEGAMRSYLTFMGSRIVEMRRVLKDTGSIYLHCDPSASHYLKLIMDSVFGQDKFRNEISWMRDAAGKGAKRVSKQWPRVHDVILYYSNTNNHIYNQVYTELNEKQSSSYSNIEQGTGRRFKTVQLGDYSEKSIQNMKDNNLIYTSKSGKEYKKYYLDEAKSTISSMWTDIPGFGVRTNSKERLGYPTQKPIALYERMIIASSNEGDLIMDPFCGCGTTIDAAHTLRRRWIGIDLTILALDPMQKRMRERHSMIPHIDYVIEGYPTNMQEVMKLVKDEKRHHDFSNWAVTRLGFKPTKHVGDGGKDGITHFQNWKPDGSEIRVFAEVKTGKPTIGQVKSFLYSMNDQNAEAGVFISLDKPSSGMKDLASRAGRFEHAGRTYPKLQFWTIDDSYFENPEIVKQKINLPHEWNLDAIRKSERHVDDTQLDLFSEDMSRPQLESHVEELERQIAEQKNKRSS